MCMMYLETGRICTPEFSCVDVSGGIRNYVLLVQAPSFLPRLLLTI
jgi:hypothetical protein